jgi:hypothetical protein
MIPDSTVQTIKDAADIHDVVARFVDLKKSGVRYLGLCPFHTEKTGSFTVTPAKNTCKCFGCGKGGDAVWFVMEYLKKTYPEALEYLAGLYNISIDTTGGKPKKDFTAPPRPTPPPPPPTSYFPKDRMLASLKGYERNHFARFLMRRFGADIASGLIGAYFVGTASHWLGANIFWQIDIEGRVRSGKVMVYNPETGKRNRDIKPTWAHTAANLKDFVLSQCFFGEHLLSKRPTAPVGIVESEKTAMIATAYLPENIWLASGGKDGLGLNKCAVLKGRRVTLWPDAGLPDANGKTAFQIWSDKAAELQKAGYSVGVSDLIERLATSDERANGYDLADYLLRFDLAEFQSVEVPQDAPPSPTANEVEPGDAQGYPASWDEPTPPAPSRLQIAATLLASHGWVAGRVQAITDDSESDWQAARERAGILADWNDFKAGLGDNPYTSHSN